MPAYIEPPPETTTKLTTFCESVSPGAPVTDTTSGSASSRPASPVCPAPETIAMWRGSRTGAVASLQPARSRASAIGVVLGVEMRMGLRLRVAYSLVTRSSLARHQRHEGVE